jgi:hypothetical protein
VTLVLSGAALYWVRFPIEPAAHWLAVNHPWPIEVFVLFAWGAMIWGIIDAFRPDKPKVEVIPPEKPAQAQRRKG